MAHLKRVTPLIKIKLETVEFFQEIKRKKKKKKSEKVFAKMVKLLHQRSGQNSMFIYIFSCIENVLLE